MPEPNPKAEPDASNRRAHYRVEYPTQDRPVFTVGELRGAVTDCSETGVRVLFPAGGVPDLGARSGDRMSGTVRFARNETIDVEGVVVRNDGKTLTLRLDAATIPFGRILKEQWWLRQRYPWRDGR